MDEQENYDGQAIYLNYPEFKGSAANAVKIGNYDLGKTVAQTLGVGRLPVGHAAIITIDENGNSRHTEYGRYTTKDGNLIGKVRDTVKGGNWRQKVLSRKRKDEDLKAYMRRVHKSLPAASTGMTQATYIHTKNGRETEDIGHDSEGEFFKKGNDHFWQGVPKWNFIIQ